MKFKVHVYDNFNYMDEDSQSTAGEYNTAKEAVACAEEIVDDFMQGAYKPGMTAKKLYDQYMAFGRNPTIVGPETVSFSASNYARGKAAELCKKRD